MQLQDKRPLYARASPRHPTGAQFALIRSGFCPAAQRRPGATDEGRKTQRATATAHNHRFKKPTLLPRNGASPPRAARRTPNLGIPPAPTPTHDAFVGSRGGEGSWQADGEGGQAASKELPAISRGWRQRRRRRKRDGFSQVPAGRVTLRVSAAASPPSPYARADGERSPHRG